MVRWHSGVVAGCLVVCALTLVAQPCDVAMAATQGSDNAASASQSSGAEKTEGPLDWLFNLLFGKSSGSASESSAQSASSASADGEARQSPSSQSASTASAAASSSKASSASVDDPFKAPIESGADAVNRIHDCLMRAGKELPQYIEYDRTSDEGRYVVHGYEVVSDGKSSGSEPAHEATWFWYSVGTDGSIYDEILMCDIDPLTMEKASSAKQSQASQSDYYALNLPWQLASAQINFEKGSLGGATTVGDITTIMLDGQIVFEVVCFSDDWGPQGTMGFVNLGSPSANPSCDVYVTVPAKDTPDGGYGTDEAAAKARDYAAYVTLK